MVDCETGKATVLERDMLPHLYDPSSGHGLTDAAAFAFAGMRLRVKRLLKEQRRLSGQRLGKKILEAIADLEGILHAFQTGTPANVPAELWEKALHGHSKAIGRAQQFAPGAIYNQPRFLAEIKKKTETSVCGPTKDAREEARTWLSEACVPGPWTAGDSQFDRSFAGLAATAYNDIVLIREVYKQSGQNLTPGARLGEVKRVFPELRQLAGKTISGVERQEWLEVLFGIPDREGKRYTPERATCKMLADICGRSIRSIQQIIKRDSAGRSHWTSQVRLARRHAQEARRLLQSA